MGARELGKKEAASRGSFDTTCGPLRGGRDRQLEVLIGVARSQGYTLGALARHCGHGERNFRRRFSDLQAGRPSDWLAELRMLDARNFLAAGNRPKEVAGRVGFKYLTDFTRAFKRAFGVTPGAFFRGQSGSDGHVSG